VLVFCLLASVSCGLGQQRCNRPQKSCVFLAPEAPHQLGQMVPVRMAADDANSMAEQLKQPTRRRW
ncbi:unnamed protein product, partial [Tetraodon nigroviridis]